MAVRKQEVSSSGAVAVAVAVAMAIALLVAAAEAGTTCNVDVGAVMHHCKSACSSWGGGATPSPSCCRALRHADFGCVCRNYWGTLRSTGYAGCAMAIPSRCNIRGAPTSC